MKKVFYPLLSVCLIAASCSSDDKAGNAEMSISSCYVMKNNSTRLESFSSPIGMYVLTEDGQLYGDGTYYASYSSGAWSMNSPVYVTKAGSVYSYFPYKSGDTPPDLTVNMNDQEDFLYSKVAASIAPGSSSLSVKLYHALSQLTVSVEGEEIASLSLQSPTTCKLNICTGVFTGSVPGKVTAQSGQLLVIPHTAVGTEIKIVLKDGKEYAYPVSGTNYRTGENYTYLFQLNENREKLRIVSFSVEDWINDEPHKDYLRR